MCVSIFSNDGTLIFVNLFQLGGCIASQIANRIIEMLFNFPNIAQKSGQKKALDFPLHDGGSCTNDDMMYD